MKNKTPVIFVDANGDGYDSVLLTDDQLRLLDWFRERDWLIDELTYILPEDATEEI